VQLHIMLHGKPMIQTGTYNHKNLGYEQCIVSYVTASCISTKGNVVILEYAKNITSFIVRNNIL
jgi:hypothetical protein